MQPIPITTSIASTVQQDAEADHHQPQDSSVLCDHSRSSNSSSSSFYERIWRFVREKVLAPPRRKVRSASYSPQSELQSEQQHMTRKQTKPRAKSCGHESESGGTANKMSSAWQKSKMLQELEASVDGVGREQSSTTAGRTATKTRVRPFCEVSKRPPIQEKCRNCAQVFFTSTVMPQTLEYCSLDCKSTFLYLEGMQRFVDERINEEEEDDRDADSMP